MKKIICVMSLLAIIFSSLPAAYAAEQAVVSDENFENYRVGDVPDTWTYPLNSKAEGNYADVEEDPFDPNNKVLMVHGNEGPIVWAKKIFKPIGGFVTVNYRYMLADASNSVQYTGLIPEVLNNMTYKGSYVYAGVGTIANMAPTPNVWHECKLELDFSERRFNVTVDGDVYASSIPFTNLDLESITEFHFGCTSKWICVDDFKISYVGGIVKNYTKIATDTYLYNSSLRGIYNVPLDTTEEEFYKNIHFVDGAKYDLYESDSETPYTKRYLEDFCILRIKSPDSSQDLRITVQIRPWVASQSTVSKAYDCVVLFENSCSIMVKNKKRYIADGNENIKPFKEGNVT